ncbi:MAG: 4'-phosphopantetheinyl transferase superfamily protein, partial [Nocardioides sp.]|uniref:4'-phosphopantetheinyl transferase superfamily protein n=1 Tax=Nocardioides sp. TaxID=35761 RepID=UPI0039E538C3
AWRALGLDLEPDLPLPPDAAAVALTDRERGGVDPADGRLVFAAKECVHKAIHPLTGIWLEFDEVEIALDLTGDPSAPANGEGAWTPRPLSDQARRALAGVEPVGRWQRSPAGWRVVLGLRSA